MTDHQRTFFDDEHRRDMDAKHGGFPYVAGSDTSRQAAESLSSEAMSWLKQQIAAYIANSRDGATCDEIEVVFQLRHQTASARIRELVQSGMLRDSGERRATRSGRMARIYLRTNERK